MWALNKCKGLRRSQVTHKQDNCLEPGIGERKLLKCCSTMPLLFQRAGRQKQGGGVQASLVKHKVTLALVWSSHSSDVCDKRVIQLEMNWEKKKGPCKSGELCSSHCDHAPFSLGLTLRHLDNPWCLMKSRSWQTSQVHSISNSTERDCSSLWQWMTAMSCCTIGILVRVATCRPVYRERASPFAAWRRRIKKARESSLYWSPILSILLSLVTSISPFTPSTQITEKRTIKHYL